MPFAIHSGMMNIEATSEKGREFMTNLECVYSDTAKPFERHFHNAYELLYVMSGQIEILIGEQCYTVSPHTLVFISKLEDHSVRLLDSHYRRYYMLIPPDKLPQLVPEPRLRGVFVNRPLDFCHLFPLQQFADVEAVWSNLVRETTGQQSFSMLYISSLLTQMLISCYREHTERFSALFQPVNPAIYEIRAYLEQHFNEPLSLSDLAAQYFMNSCYVSHCFTAAVGCSPKKYIMLNRVAKAKELLLTTKIPIQDISIQCGFNDTNNFIRLFKRETGVTPRQYRENAR